MNIVIFIIITLFFIGSLEGLNNRDRYNDENNAR